MSCFACAHSYLCAALVGGPCRGLNASSVFDHSPRPRTKGFGVAYPPDDLDSPGHHQRWHLVLVSGSQTSKSLTGKKRSVGDERVAGFVTMNTSYALVQANVVPKTQIVSGDVVSADVCFRACVAIWFSSSFVCLDRSPSYFEMHCGFGNWCVRSLILRRSVFALFVRPFHGA